MQKLKIKMQNDKHVIVIYLLYIFLKMTFRELLVSSYIFSDVKNGNNYRKTLTLMEIIFSGMSVLLVVVINNLHLKILN